MALIPLGESQRATVADLVAQGRIEQVSADANRARTFANRAAAAITDLANLTHTDIAYNVAYDACHDVGEALLAAYGYRTKAGIGQHDAVGRFLQAVLADPPGNQAAASYDRIRRARNRNRYSATPVGQNQVTHAKSVAQALLAAAKSRGVGT